jgi:hypothetical protein
MIMDDASREKLMALHDRYSRLLAQLPTDPSEFDDLDGKEVLAKLDDMELITREMETIHFAERAILDELLLEAKRNDDG